MSSKGLLLDAVLGVEKPRLRSEPLSLKAELLFSEPCLGKSLLSLKLPVLLLLAELRLNQTELGQERVDGQVGAGDIDCLTCGDIPQKGCLSIAAAGVVKRLLAVVIEWNR